MNDYIELLCWFWSGRVSSDERFFWFENPSAALLQGEQWSRDVIACGVKRLITPGMQYDIDHELAGKS